MSDDCSVTPPSDATQNRWLHSTTCSERSATHPSVYGKREATKFIQNSHQPDYLQSCQVLEVLRCWASFTKVGLTIIRTTTVATFKIIFNFVRTPTTAIFKSDHCPNTYHGHLQIWPSSKTPTTATFKIIWPSLKTYHGHLQNCLTIIQNTCHSHLQIWPSSKQLPQPPSKSAEHHPNTSSGMATLKIIWPSSKTCHEYLHRYLTIVDTPTTANSSPAEQCAVVTTPETKVKFCF